MHLEVFHLTGFGDCTLFFICFVLAVAAAAYTKGTVF